MLIGKKVFTVLTVLMAARLVTPALGEQALRYNRDIRPILSENCFGCHGPDEKQRKSGLRLDVREEALKAAKSGDIAIVPGDLKRSALLARINTDRKSTRLNSSHG